MQYIFGWERATGQLKEGVKKHLHLQIMSLPHSKIRTRLVQCPQKASVISGKQKMVIFVRCFISLGLLTTGFVTAAPASASNKQADTKCAPIHLFVARGTSESPGDGSIGSLADLVLQQNPGATKEAIDYPALPFPVYIADVGIGIKAVTDQFTNYTSSCPDSSLVLIGYSQGTQIMLDALCGSGSILKGGLGIPTITEAQGKKSKLSSSIILSTKVGRLFIELIPVCSN